jgi:glycosyltransferase involved in cell wall biosynthesis
MGRDRITFAGQLPREEVLARVAQCDVFAQMSLVEGHSLALIEAGRIGLPLVVSDVASQREGERGGRQPVRAGAAPHDPAVLAAALNRCWMIPRLCRCWRAGDAAGAGQPFATQLGRYRALIDAVLAPRADAARQAVRGQPIGILAQPVGDYRAPFGLDLQGLPRGGAAAESAA